MKVFIAASYSSQVDYKTGRVKPEYKKWLEDVLLSIEAAGHTVFCALRADKYQINNDDPAAAFKLDLNHIRQSAALIALLAEKASAGVQTEIGVGIALNKKVILAHLPEHQLAYFNAAMIKAGVARELELPLNSEKLDTVLRK